MLALASRVLCAGALLGLGVIACAPATSGARQESRYVGAVAPLTPTARVIDANRIQRSGSNSALDAIRALVPGYRSIDTSPGTASLGSTILSRGRLRVLVDGHPIADVESLRMIPARDVIAIHVLSAPDATVRFGPSFSGGAIVIQTWGTRGPLD
jgi:hypothetical protein